MQGWDDVSFHGNPEIPKPNIDRIANHGVILQQYYTTPYCEESLSAFRTGKHPIHYSKTAFSFNLGTNEKEMTLLSIFSIRSHLEVFCKKLFQNIYKKFFVSKL